MSDVKMYTVKEFAALTGRKEDTVRRWIYQGKLNTVWTGSKKSGHRIPETELTRICKERKVRVVYESPTLASLSLVSAKIECLNVDIEKLTKDLKTLTKKRDALIKIQKILEESGLC